MQKWEENIRKVVPYVPGEQPRESNIIKLNTNENPYPPSPLVKKAMEELEVNKLRLYPDPVASELVGELANYYRVDESQIFVGVGSDDVLAMAFMTFFNSSKPILFPDITYSFYDVWADLFRIPYERVSLDDNFHINPGDYYKENGGVIFPNPNAPTGIYEKIEVIEDILRHNTDSIVIIDEAYVDFAPKSCLELLNKYENLVIVQTFSKSRSMAGLRVGFAIASRKLIKALNDVKYSYNSYTMDYTSIKLGAAAVKDDEYFKATVKKIITTREQMKVSLRELGFKCLDSQSNFLFITHPKKRAKEIFESLKQQKIFVRYFDKERINNYLRVTIGTEEEMKELIIKLRDILLLDF